MNHKSFLFVFVLVVCALLVSPVLSQAQDLDKKPLDTGADYLKKLLSPEDFDALFYKKVVTPAVYQALPPPKMKEIINQLTSQAGYAQKWRLIKKKNDQQGLFWFMMTKEKKMKVFLYVEKKSPHRIAGLRFASIVPRSDSMERVLKEVQNLPGEASVYFTSLGEKKKNIFSHREDRVLAVGSAFKLYILGALVDEIEEGSTRWSRVLRLKKKYFAPSSKGYQNWPQGAPVTLYSLAAKMISLSDNTATDHLLHYLGRKRVEKQLAPMGNRQLKRNAPFLSTGEMIKMKFAADSTFRKTYLGLDSQGRRLYLDKVISRLVWEDMEYDVPTKARNIDTLEWFASAKELTAAMDWLRKASEKGAGKKVRGILEINNPLSVEKKHWKYVGYKGGSEEGVLNLTFLLQDKKNRWYGLALTWNNTKGPAPVSKLLPLAQRIVDLYGEREFSKSKEKSKR